MIKKKNLKKITLILKRLYPRKNDKVIVEQISSIIEKAKAKKANQKKSHAPPFKDWNESNIVLITYGDMVKSSKQKPLAVLHKFLDAYARDIIDIVHILPFYPYTSDDGFAVVDYQQIDEKLGDWQNITTLANKYALIFDGVINHISAKSDWFQKALAGDKKYLEYFIHLTKQEQAEWQLNKVVRPRNLPLLSNYEVKIKDGSHKKGSAKQTLDFWTTFSADQLDLNYHTTALLLEIINLMFYYAYQGARAIRLDAIAFLWKKKKTNCLHLRETHQVIELIRLVLNEVYTEVLLLSETNVPHKENISYFGKKGSEAQMVYQFPLPPLVAHSFVSGNANKLSEWARALPPLRSGTTFFNFLASHDGVGMRPLEGIVSEEERQALVDTCKNHGGFISYKQNSDGSKSPYELNINYSDLIASSHDSETIRIAKILLAHSILLVMPGIPAFYFHSLVGSKNDLDGVEKTGANRSINRQKFDYTYLDKKLKDENSFEQKIFTALKKMIAIRKAEPLFHPENPFQCLHTPSNANSQTPLFALKRTNQPTNDAILTLHNFANHSTSFNLKRFAKNGEVIDILTDKIYDGNTNLIPLKPYAVMWLKRT